MKSKSIYLFSIIGLGIIGLILSYLLAVEYYGTSELANSLCSSLGSEDSCTKVKESPYSSFPIPILGNVPIALLGFTFYGFTIILSYLSLKKEQENFHVPILFTLSAIAVIIDIILFGISFFIIKAICSLCFLTYLVSIGIFLVSLTYVKKIFQGNTFSMLKSNLLSSVNKNFFSYILITLAFFACGFWFSQSNNPKTSKAASSQELIAAKIAAYEKAPIVSIDLQGVPFAGDDKAPITIVKYADFNCVHCMHASHILDAILSEFSGLVKVYYKNFPLDGNCNRLVQRKTPDASSCLAASFALCAYKQNKFLPAYHALYKDNEIGIRHNPSSISKIAENLGMKLSTIQACMSSSEIANYIAKEVNEGDKLNIQSTPSIFVNNKPLEPGTPDPMFLRELIKHLTKKL